MKYYPRTIYTLLILITLTLNLLAQTRFSINYTTNDGLIQNTVRYFIQDSRSRLWIGTAEGVSIYDGTGFSNFPPIENLKNPVINCFYKIGKDTILAATNGAGVAVFVNRKYNTDSVEAYYMGKKYLTSDYVYYIMKDREGHFWFCTDSGVTRWRNINILKQKVMRPGDIKHFYEIDNSPWLSVSKAVEGKDGGIWFGSAEGLARYFNGKLKNYTSKTGFANLPVSTIYLDNKNKLWIGTSSGIKIYENNKFINFSLNNKIGKVEVNSILQDKNNIYWFGTNKGLFYYDNKEVKNFWLGDQYGANFIITLFEDEEGNIWAGTIHGAYKLQVTNFSLLKGSSELNYVYKIIPDNNKNLWVLTSGGLFKIKDDQLLPITNINNIPSKNIRAVVFGKNNIMWIGTDKGLFKLNNGFLENINFNSSQNNKSIVSLTDIGNNILLVGTNHGMSVIPKNQNANKQLIKNYRKIFNKLPKGPARSVLVDGNGNIWIGFLYSGLFEIKGKSVNKITNANNFTASNIRNIYEDSKNNLWVATRYNGVYEHKKNSWLHYTANDGLSSNWVSTIIEGKDGQYWFGTARGLSLLNGNKWRIYDATDGAVSGEVTTSAIDAAGNLWFGTFNGIYKYNNIGESTTISKPFVFIKQIEVNGRRDINFNSKKIKVLSYNQNTISFEYVGVWLKNETKIYYKYILSGFDKNWSRTLTSNYIRFHNLPPAKYEFKVIAGNADGIWDSTPAEVSFIIKPPFWEEWWFISLIIIMSAAVVFLIYNYKIKRVLELERLKIKIASDLHDDIGVTLSRISLISELIKENIEPEKIKSNLNDIGQLSRQAINTMRDIIWSIDTRNDNLGSLINRIKDSFSAVLPDAGISYSFVQSGISEKKKVSAEIRKNIYLIAKESLNNILKHSDAKNVVVEFQNIDGNFNLVISDDGKGLNHNQNSSGHGLRNIKMRAKEINANLMLENSHGTKITLEIKIT